MDKKEALRAVLYYYLKDNIANLTQEDNNRDHYFDFDAEDFDEEDDLQFFDEEYEDNYYYSKDLDEEISLNRNLLSQMGYVAEPPTIFLGHENDTDEEYAAYVDSLSLQEYADEVQKYKDSVENVLFDSDKSLEERLASFISRRSALLCMYDENLDIVSIDEETDTKFPIYEDLYEILGCITGENGQDHTLLEKMVCTPEFEAKWPTEIGTLLDDYTRTIGEDFGLAKIPIEELPEIMLTDSSCLLAYIEMYTAQTTMTPDMNRINFVKSYQKSIDQLRGNMSMDKKVSAFLEQVNTLDKAKDGKTIPGGEGIGE